MPIAISKDQFQGVSPSARRETVAAVSQATASKPHDKYCSTDYLANAYRGLAMSGMADLTENQVDEYMAGLSKAGVKALRVFAEYGPVITSKQLREGGVRSASPLRAEAIIRLWHMTGAADTALISIGRDRFGVTTETYDTLRRYFGDDPVHQRLRRQRSSCD